MYSRALPKSLFSIRSRGLEAIRKGIEVKKEENMKTAKKKK